MRGVPSDDLNFLPVVDSTKSRGVGYFCSECGTDHSEELRHRILRRMLPCTAADVLEAWPHYWPRGSRGEGRPGGSKTLSRDLRALGAVNVGGTWVLKK